MYVVWFKLNNDPRDPYCRAQSLKMAANNSNYGSGKIAHDYFFVLSGERLHHYDLPQGSNIHAPSK